MSKKVLLLTSTLIIVSYLLGVFVIISRQQRLAGPEITKSDPWISPTSLFGTKPQLPAVTTLSQVFDGTLVDESDDLVTLLVTGDVLLAREVNRLIQVKNDPTWPWLNTGAELRMADLTFINLETPLIANCPVRSDGMIFCGANSNVAGLIYAGVDLVNIANNHMANWGDDGVAQTVQNLKANNLGVVGYDGPVYRQVGDTKFAFLGYNDVGVQPGVAHAEDELMWKQISLANDQSDVVVVQFHWGAEYRYQPIARQVELAHRAIDLGADLVVSNHPHWFQSLEFYQDKLIVYSHGNFIFDQMWSLETRQGVVGKYIFQEDRLVDVEFLPVLIEDYGQPRWLDREEKTKIIEKLKEISISPEI